MNPRRRTRKELLTLLYKFLFLKNATYRLRRCGTLREPVLCALRVNLHVSWASKRVVLSDHLQKTDVSRPALIDDDNPIMGPFLRSDPRQTHCYQTVNLQ